MPKLNDVQLHNLTPGELMREAQYMIDHSEAPAILPELLAQLQTWQEVDNELETLETAHTIKLEALNSEIEELQGAISCAKTKLGAVLGFLEERDELGNFNWDTSDKDNIAALGILITEAIEYLGE